ncbi:MAG: 4'-phosphopantetheinyl transferase family protein [Marinomonas sp.]|jgi:4'-phosphopantetheinyl transferase|uniref:4'-phosphopantetheinyl transferase n=1 Tax=Marinomonas sp. (strain MWYL1) TaxID=400668 RepID=A6W241_MARMS
MQSDIHVFFANVEMLSDDSLEYFLDALPADQKAKALELKSKKKKRDFIIGRMLLIHALLKKYSFRTIPSILEQPDKAPFVRSFKDIYLSISHSNYIVCCVLHECPIGIDIEYKKSRQNLAEKSSFFMSHEELEELTMIIEETRQKEYFYQVWCTKEAVFKALDFSEQKSTTLMSIHLSDFFSGGGWSLFQKEIDNYHLSLVYGGGERQVQLIPVDLGRGFITGKG